MKDILALTADEGCRVPGINQITKQKTKASEGKELKKKDTMVENWQFDWGAQMHLSSTILQSSSGGKNRR